MPEASNAHQLAADLILEVTKRAAIIEELRGALVGLATNQPDGQLCWCAMQTDRPSKISHTAACLAARAAVAKLANQWG
jgi:hypothetical protein